MRSLTAASSPPVSSDRHRRLRLLARTAVAEQCNATAAVPRIGGHFALSMPDGRRVTDATFRGKWLLVYFGYTSCPDVCPTTLSAMALALDKLGPLADKVQPVFITVDPERDTPQIVGEYVKDFDPRFVGLVGSPERSARRPRNFTSITGCGSSATTNTWSTTARSSM